MPDCQFFFLFCHLCCFHINSVSFFVPHFLEAFFSFLFLIYFLIYVASFAPNFCFLVPQLSEVYSLTDVTRPPHTHAHSTRFLSFHSFSLLFGITFLCAQPTYTCMHSHSLTCPSYDIITNILINTAFITYKHTFYIVCACVCIYTHLQTKYWH